MIIPKDNLWKMKLKKKSFTMNQINEKFKLKYKMLI